MLQCVFRPLEAWPHRETPSHQRKGFARFKAGHVDTLNVLERELRHLRAKDVVVEIECGEQEIRNDGWPRSDARVRGPKVAISFQSRHGPLVYRCDMFTGWQANMRAVALTLERLRMSDMYGVTRRGEQYTGFKALPAGIKVGPAVMDLEEAERMLHRYGLNYPGYSPIDVDKAYRTAALALHPDRGGKPEEWHRLQEAKASLDAQWRDA